MAISFQQGASAGAANAGPVTVTFDATPAADDLILVFHTDGDTSDNAMPTPTGYTDVGSSEQYANGSSNDCNSRAHYKYSDGTETDVVLADTGGGANDGVSAVVMIFRGVATAAQGGPFSTAPTLATGTGSANADPPSIATAAGDVVVIMGGAAQATGGAVTAPANYTTNAELGTNGVDTIDSRAAMAYRTSGYGNPEDPAAFAFAGSAAGDSWNAVTLALKEAAAPQIDGVVLTVTPSLPVGALAHSLTGTTITVTPTLPVGAAEFPLETGWDEAGRFWTTKVSEEGRYPAASDTISEVGVLLRDLVVAGGQTVTGVVLTVTPSLPAGTLDHSLTGVVVTATPSLPTGALEHRLGGIALTATPSLPTGALQHTITGTALTATPTLPAGQVTTPGAQTVTGIVLTITPTLPVGSLSHSLTGVVLTATPSLPVGTLDHRLTGVVVTATPSLPTGTVNRSLTGVAITATPSLPVGVLGHTVTGIALTVTPTLPVGQVTIPGPQTVTGIALTVTPVIPTGTVARSSILGVVVTITPELPIGTATTEAIGIPVPYAEARDTLSEAQAKDTTTVGAAR